MPTKAQARQGSKNAGRYKNQFFITERNKKRRSEKRAKIAVKRAA